MDIKSLSNEELIGKLCIMYSLYPMEKVTSELWKETLSRLENRPTPLAQDGGESPA